MPVSPTRLWGPWEQGTFPSCFSQQPKRLASVGPEWRSEWRGTPSNCPHDSMWINYPFFVARSQYFSLLWSLAKDLRSFNLKTNLYQESMKCSYMYIHTHIYSPTLANNKDNHLWSPIVWREGRQGAESMWNERDRFQLRLYHFWGQVKWCKRFQTYKEKF